MPDAAATFPSRLPHVGTTIFTVMSRLAAECGAINLSQGFPDFSPDPALLALVEKHLRAGANQYAPMAGVAPLREAIVEKAAALYGTRYDPEHEVTVTAGGTQAIFTAIACAVRPGRRGADLRAGLRLLRPGRRAGGRDGGAGPAPPPRLPARLGRGAPPALAADAAGGGQLAPQPHRRGLVGRRPRPAGGPAARHRHAGGLRRGLRAHRLRRPAPPELLAPRRAGGAELRGGLLRQDLPRHRLEDRPRAGAPPADRRVPQGPPVRGLRRQHAHPAGAGRVPARAGPLPGAGGLLPAAAGPLPRRAGGDPPRAAPLRRHLLPAGLLRGGERRARRGAGRAAHPRAGRGEHPHLALPRGARGRTGCSASASPRRRRRWTGPASGWPGSDPRPASVQPARGADATSCRTSGSSCFGDRPASRSTPPQVARPAWTCTTSGAVGASRRAARTVARISSGVVAPACRRAASDAGVAPSDRARTSATASAASDEVAAPRLQGRPELGGEPGRSAEGLLPAAARLPAGEERRRPACRGAPRPTGRPRGRRDRRRSSPRSPASASRRRRRRRGASCGWWRGCRDRRLRGGRGRRRDPGSSGRRPSARRRRPGPPEGAGGRGARSRGGVGMAREDCTTLGQRGGHAVAGDSGGKGREHRPVGGTATGERWCVPQLLWDRSERWTGNRSGRRRAVDSHLPSGSAGLARCGTKNLRGA